MSQPNYSPNRIIEIIRQKHFKDFFNRYQESKRPLLFIGSGPSIGAGYPNWKNLLIEIKNNINHRSRAKLDDNEIKIRLEQGAYAEVGSMLKKAIEPKEKAHTRWWREILEGILKSKEEVSPVHDAIVSLKWEKIITTNYDCLLEEACERANKPYEVYHPKSTDLQRSQSTLVNPIFKIHGDIKDKTSPIVLTEEDYQQIYIDESPQCLNFRRILESHLQNAQVILFIGFSHDDAYFRDWFKKVCDNRDNITPTFALFPTPEMSDAKFDDKLEQLRLDVGIRAITFNPQDDFVELAEILKYLQSPADGGTQPQKKKLERKPTVIFLYTGGTIGSIKRVGDLHEEDVLSLRKIPSRFDPRLEYSSKLLREKFHQFYHTGKDFNFDLIWEILPPNQQILSENATVDHWNNLINKLEEMLYKYVQAPRTFVGDDLRVDARLYNIYKKEIEDFANLCDKDKDFKNRINKSEEFKKAYPSGKPTQTDFIKEFEDRYIAGIIILHGTDTLDNTAAALAFGIRNLPVPIVLTGANRPPDEHKLEEKSEIYWESDTWKNLVTSLYFLQCFGHRFTEVFVCFGDTIHHGLNIRKTAIETRALNRVAILGHNVEPFKFRNYSIYKRYLFRLIDDIFCNNYYPSQLPFNQLILPNLAYLRHVRQNPFRQENGADTQVFNFGPGVKFFVASTSPPPNNVSEMFKAEKFRAVLIEGFKSGTYPSERRHPFATFMSRLEKVGIPIILVSHYGIPASQERYETDRDIPVLRLFGIIPETALPMLNLVVNSFSSQEWNKEGKRGPELSKHRRDLITKAINGLFNQESDENKSIISIEFGNITDQTAKSEYLKKIIQEEFELEQERPGPKVKYSTINIMDDNQGSLFRSPSPQVAEVVIPRSIFLWLLNTKFAEEKGSGPDGFAILADKGFDWGFYTLHHYQQSHVRRADDTPFCKYPEFQRTAVTNKAKTMLNKLASYIKNCGIADVSIDESTWSISVNDGNEDSIPRPSFSFEVTINRGEEFIRSDEKFTMQNYSEKEEEFFTLLGNGSSSHQQIEKYFEELSDRYDDLMENTWKHKTADIDWYLLGVFRGAACAIACYFYFDEWAIKYETNEDLQHLRALRQSVKCKILRSQRDIIRYVVTYYAWNQHKKSVD